MRSIIAAVLVVAFGASACSVPPAPTHELLQFAESDHADAENWRLVTRSAGTAGEIDLGVCDSSGRCFFTNDEISDEENDPLFALAAFEASLALIAHLDASPVAPELDLDNDGIVDVTRDDDYVSLAQAFTANGDLADERADAASCARNVGILLLLGAILWKTGRKFVEVVKRTNITHAAMEEIERGIQRSLQRHGTMVEQLVTNRARQMRNALISEATSATQNRATVEAAAESLERTLIQHGEAEAGERLGSAIRTLQSEGVDVVQAGEEIIITTSAGAVRLTRSVVDQIATIADARFNMNVLNELKALRRPAERSEGRRMWALAALIPSTGWYALRIVIPGCFSDTPAPAPAVAPAAATTPPAQR